MALLKLGLLFPLSLFKITNLLFKLLEQNENKLSLNYAYPIERENTHSKIISESNGFR